MTNLKFKLDTSWIQVKSIIARVNLLSTFHCWIKNLHYLNVTCMCGRNIWLTQQAYYALSLAQATNILTTIVLNYFQLYF
jgi:hypothetical protein